MNFLNGMGLALQDAQANGYVGSLAENLETKMGVIHCVYGLGAFASALVSTQFSQMERWSFHYLVSLGLAILNSLSVMLVFRFRRQEDNLKAAGEIVTEANEGATSFKTIMASKTVHVLAFFLFVYVGLEIAIGGWITTFIIEVRGGGPSSGYIATGYFGALAVGRVILLPVNALVGERWVVYLYGLLTLGLEFVVWFVPSLVGNGIAVAFMGLFMAPMYPLAMNQASRVLPSYILTGAIGWIAAFGQAGSAIVPFMAGAIAQKHGISSLHPVSVAMIGALMVLWFLAPNQARSS
ncbi:MFS transporter [Coprinopsis cinerea AmutBmut pab1-1]|nr:MFS transporter [Coprinopsis cinerea AmutBmut pab1-1]